MIKVSNCHEDEDGQAAEFGDVHLTISHKLVLIETMEEPCEDDPACMHQVATLSATYLSLEEAKKLMKDLHVVISKIQANLN